MVWERPQHCHFWKRWCPPDPAPELPLRRRNEYGWSRLRRFTVCRDVIRGELTQFLYSPEKTGKDFEIAPKSALISLKPYQEYLTIISNTDVRMAEALNAPEIGGDHFRSSAVFLTQAHPKQTQGSDIWCGASLDQLYAQKFGQDSAPAVNAVLY